MTNDQFFVGVSNPKEIRKDLLMSSKQVVEALVALEQYKAVREEKQALLAELKKNMDSLVFLNKKLRSHLPRVKHAPRTAQIAHDHMLKSEIEAKKKQEPKKAVKQQKVAPPPKKKTRLEELREELEQYEKKLAKLE